MSRRRCLLWSGGKDSFLAYLLTSKGFDDQWVFVTFVPKVGFFRCHPFPILLEHGRYFGMPHEFIVIDDQTWLSSYRRAFAFLKATYEIHSVISGDILSTRGRDYRVTDIPNVQVPVESWMDMLGELGLKFEAPLSEYYAEDILDLLPSHGICAVVTGMSDEWVVEGMVGQPLSLNLLKSTSLYSDPSFDVCGERGEYHTTVIRFRQKVFSNVDPGTLGIKLINGVWVLDWAESWLDYPIQRRTLDR